jgi:hypothetical protein
LQTNRKWPPAAYQTGLATLDLVSGEFTLRDFEDTAAIIFSTVANPVRRHEVYGVYTTLSKIDRTVRVMRLPGHAGALLPSDMGLRVERARCFEVRKTGRWHGTELAGSRLMHGLLPTAVLDPPHGTASPAVPALIGSGPHQRPLRTGCTAG